MNKSWWLLLIILCLAGVGFVIFGVQQGQNEEALPLPAKPGRIVSLAPNLTEILFALGLGDKIVAVSTNSDHPHEAGEKKKGRDILAAEYRSGDSSQAGPGNYARI